MVNQTISHFKILEKIGQGGMGEVYLAEDTILKRKIALKLLAPQWSSDEGLKARFMQEAQAAAALKHPNIVTIYEMAEFEGQFYIAMEYIEGEPLTALIQRDLETTAVLRIVIQICDGLAAAHQRNIVHRDIKPANIMVVHDGGVKILDFGIAKLKLTVRLTSQSMIIGTIPYMSPEQILSSNVDHRSDLFSLGVVLYEMLTMQHPFESDHDEAMKYAILNTDPEPLSRYKKGVSDGLQRIIDKSVEKDLETRYQNGADFSADLKRELKAGNTDAQPTIVLADGGFRKSQDEKSKTVKGKKSHKSYKKKAIGIVFLAVLALVIFFALRVPSLVDFKDQPSESHSIIMTELIQISDATQLKDQMTEYSQEMRIAVGSKEDFMNPEGCYIFLLNDNEVAGVFVYKDEAFHDVNSQETFLDLPDNLKDAVPIWVQDFSDSQIR